MPRKSKLFLLGRAFGRLSVQKQCLHPAVKEKINKEALRFESTVNKRIHEQNTRITSLKTKKDQLEQKLDTELKKYNMNEGTQASKIRIEGNALLFKFMKHGMVVLIFGTGFLAGKIYELC